MRDRLESLVFACVDPPPKISVKDYRIDDKLILVLSVEPGPSTPYALISGTGERQRPEYYVRRGASTARAQPTELQYAVTSRMQAESEVSRRSFL